MQGHFYGIRGTIRGKNVISSLYGSPAHQAVQASFPKITTKHILPKCNVRSERLLPAHPTPLSHQPRNVGDTSFAKATNVNTLVHSREKKSNPKLKKTRLLTSRSLTCFGGPHHHLCKRHQSYFIPSHASQICQPQPQEDWAMYDALC